MNLFLLDKNLENCAQAHIDSHIVKMPIELAQLLCSTHHMCLSLDLPDFIYKLTHKNHPCALFTRECIGNYNYVTCLAIKLLEEYKHRYGKEHASSKVIQWCANHLPNISTNSVSNFALCMPDEHKTICPIESYRNYYLTKTHKKNGQVMMSYTNRKPPEWLLDKFKFVQVNNRWVYNGPIN